VVARRVRSGGEGSEGADAQASKEIENQMFQNKNQIYRGHYPLRDERKGNVKRVAERGGGRPFKSNKEVGGDELKKNWGRSCREKERRGGG